MPSAGTYFVQSSTNYNASEVIIAMNPSCASAYECFKKTLNLISNFRRVLNVLCFLLGNSPASEFYMPTFRNTLFHLHRQVVMKDSSYIHAYEDGRDRVLRNIGISNSDGGELPRRKQTTILNLFV
jgi:hypothetical protein